MDYSPTRYPGQVRWRVRNSRWFWSPYKQNIHLLVIYLYDEANASRILIWSVEHPTAILPTVDIAAYATPPIGYPEYEIIYDVLQHAPDVIVRVTDINWKVEIEARGFLFMYCFCIWSF